MHNRAETGALMTREPYTYALLRYRHDPVAGEMVNVGVVLYAPKNGYLGGLFRKAFGRISKVFPDVNGAVLRRDLTRIERAFIKSGKDAKLDLLSDHPNVLTFARRIVGVDDSAFLWSEVGSGTTSNPAKTLEELHMRFVGQYDEFGAHRRQDAEIWKPFRDRLVERAIGDIFTPKTIRSKTNAVDFEHAWKNGKWHCIQALSFDLVTEDGIQEKAARWVGHMVGLSKATEKFQPYFLVGQPSDEKMHPAYERALAFLRESPLEVVVIPELQIDSFADSWVDKVKASELGRVVI